MGINGVSTGSAAALQWLQSQNQVQANQAAQASSDPDHDGDVDGAGPDTNDGRGQHINVKA